MKKILLPLLLSAFFPIKCMHITCPASGELPTIDYVVENCTSHITQLIMSPVLAISPFSGIPRKVIQVDSAIDAQLCCQIHQNARMNWEIKMHQYKDETGKIHNILYLEENVVNTENANDLFRRLLTIYNRSVITPLKTNWNRGKSKKAEYVEINKKNSDALKEEECLIASLLARFHFDPKNINAGIYTRFGKKSSTFVEIKRDYKATFDLIFEFHIGLPRTIDLTIDLKTSERLS